MRSEAAAIIHWHRPLMLVAMGSVALLAVCCLALIVDSRTLTGAAIWLKPTKFAISVAIYCATLGWLVSLLQRGRRVGYAVGLVVAVMLVGELVIIVTQVIRGRASHFNQSTSLDSGLWFTMAGMIAVLWLANLVLAVLLLRQQIRDRSTTSAIRIGICIAIAGMGIAFLMPNQGTDDREGSGIVGAHTVGAAGGGPGLPVTGWSTEAGDLRVPHFIGIHGLQVMLALRLTFLRHRQFPRVEVIRIVGAGYAGLFGITAWQALRGQSLVHPDLLTLSATAALALACASAVWLALRRQERRCT